MKKNLSSYFFINNTKINNIEKNRNIIDYLENLNIKIPHYCYHQKLSVSGNCRMCLVELKNSPKPLVSCAMTITNKMEIFTESPLVKKARENILEFLLLNHPLDCPICDQGGECDLQDQSVVFGSGKKRFYNYRRSITNKNLGPIVKTVMTRCIHCTKCVRFATEIAGVSDLGMFGRGYNSEIGTYVSKIFNTELSGNIIDICPVGALTSKPYSFIDRSWELSKVHSIDFTDSFGLDLSLSVKAQSTITKVQPSYNKQDLSNSWITNKTRFCFDGMFSPEKLSNLNVSLLSKKNNSWEKIFKEIINILFFHDHLNNFIFSTSKLNFLVGEDLGVEVIGILFLLHKKYNFININKTERCFVNTDLETNFITRSANNEFSLKNSNICLLIGINTRFESPSLNIKLRQRVLQGNFKVYSINSCTDLNFACKNLGNNLTILKRLSEGNHLMCQEFTNSKNPLIIYNSNLYKKPIINSYLNYIKSFSITTLKKWEGTNFVSKTLSESNINFLNNLPHLSKKAYLNSLGLYCLNLSPKELFFKKLVYMKYLNYLSKPSNSKTYLVNQNHMPTISFKKSNISNVIINLPNTSFFESSNRFITTEGFLKKTVKVISTKNSSKSNWVILRNVLSLLNSELKQSEKITTIFESCNFVSFLKFINLNYLSIQNYKKSHETLQHKKSAFFLKFGNIKKLSPKKNFKTKTYFWLNDFHIGGKDMYSNYSKIMIECSKFSRLNDANFKFL